MRLVKRVLPSGKVEFTRTFYVLFAVEIVLMVIACIGLVKAAIG